MSAPHPSHLATQHSPSSKLATASAGRRTKYLVLLGLIAILAFAGPLAGKIGDVEENGPTSSLPRGAESTLVEEQLATFNADGILGAAVVYNRDGGLTETDLAAIDAQRRELAPFAVRRDVSEARVSQDREAAVVGLGMDNNADGTLDRFEDFREVTGTGLPGGLEVQVTGPMAGMYDSVSAFDGVDGKILGASALVVTVLLLLTYRSPVMWLLPLASIGVAMAVSQAVIYLLAKHADLPVDGQSGGILPILVFGVGTDYALLLIARYREELHRHADRHVAMAAAIRRAGPAIFASAATVVLGLSCLMLADLNSTRSLGAVCAVGVACGAIAMLTVLPMLLTLTGRWVFWPRLPRVDTSAPDVAMAHRSRGWIAVSRHIARAPRLIWTSTALVLVALAFSVLGMNVGTTDAQKYRDTPESVTGQQVLAEHFPAGSSAPAEIVARASSASEVRTLAAETTGVASVAEPVAASGTDRVLISATLADAPDSQAAESTIERLRDRLSSVDGALVGGPTAKTLDVENASFRDAAVVIPAVLVVVMLVLVLLLRAIVGPLVLLATVVLSYAAALGAGGLVMRAMGFEAVDVSLPLISFVFLVALGVDYTIFLMSRVREEVVDHGPTSGTLRGLVATGGVITSAGLVLAATFGVLTVMPIVFMIGMGVVIALGVALDAFVVRSLLVPALAVDLGRRFWLPGDLAKRPNLPVPVGDTVRT